jgi:starch-binding outer membrane protein, SusD/RagB family
MNMTRLWILALVVALPLGGCDMDLTDPNNPTETAAIENAAGVRQIAIGLQADYGNALVNPVYTVGLVTDELGAGAATFEGFQKADRGDEILNNEGASTNTWASMYRVIRVSDVLINNAGNVGFGPGYTSGLLALGKFYKGLAFGQLYQIYPGAPINVGPNIPHPEFATREQVIATALGLLEEARQHLATAPPPTEFSSQVLAPGFSLEHSINAMIARFALMAQDYARAAEAAGRVPPGVLSEFRFSTADSNPLWNMWYNSGNAFQLRARQDFRLDAEPGDGRVDFWVEPDDLPGAVHAQLDHVRYNTASTSYPVYLPGEMLLIRAEVHARNNQLAQARELLNQVRTQCESPVAEPLACLPALSAGDLPTQADVLAAILWERRYELFLQGVRWSDLRRFDQPVKYTFMPIPSTECERNNNAPVGAGMCPAQS